MGGDDYVLDENVCWTNAAEALQWYKNQYDELKKDAERYRWLVANCQDTADEFSVSGQLYFGTYAAGKLSGSIDAMMTKEEKYV